MLLDLLLLLLGQELLSLYYKLLEVALLSLEASVILVSDKFILVYKFDFLVLIETVDFFFSLIEDVT